MRVKLLKKIRRRYRFIKNERHNFYTVIDLKTKQIIPNSRDWYLGGLDSSLCPVVDLILYPGAWSEFKANKRRIIAERRHLKYVDELLKKQIG